MPTKHVSRATRLLRGVLDQSGAACTGPVTARAGSGAALRPNRRVADALHIMALAPAERLVQALDASVWKTPRPGASEVFDPRELIEWIGAWLDIGEGFTAERLAAVPDENLMLYLSQLAIVTTTPMWGF